ncbi:MAG TPA: hypothetical protein VFK05_37280 [Polyangiaceae bacterium]|nr:hypothetical protein [Polyangiaceae bacterium]
MAAFLASCSQNPVTVNLHAMQSSGRVSFVCRGADNSASGHKLDECPDYEAGTRHTLALVTQTATNEVAVVDLAAQSIVDVDPTTPGYSFLRVGAKPGAIVTTPGGAATFVGVSGLQKDGIFALPTTCILPPIADEPARDLTTWSACHLSSAPGDIVVVVDPPVSGVTRARCPLDPHAPPIPETPPDLDGRECPADLTRENGPKGRRKLLVALPDEHKVVLLDAQRVLDQIPGTFNECEPEATFELKAPLPTTPLSPVLPADWKNEDGSALNSCFVQPSYPPRDMSAQPTPGGMAALDNEVYVADRTRPLVHVLDVSDPCAEKELEPLYPNSYSNPSRVVTTSRVAVSPVSPDGQKQFLYAIDQDDQPTASVMVFDLLRIDPQDPNTRTPLLLEGGKRQPFTPPDRLRFSAPVRDVSFVMRDFPKSDSSGVGEFGTKCDPNPDPNFSGPGAAYRPNSDYTDGARAVNLRGTFAFALLTNGQVAVIDVDDFDAPCRRPVSANPGDTEDLHGCRNDPPVGSYVIPGTTTRTVTDESSCHVIEDHRPRSASLSISSSSNGVHAPSLRAFPQFSTPGSSVTIDKQPRMMATDFDDPNSSGLLPAEVNVNSQLYAHCGVAGVPSCDGITSFNPLITNPATPGAPNSLTLPLAEPRSYAQDESLTLTFEGALFPARTSGFLDVADLGTSQEGTLRDPDANFCGGGVEDSDTIRARGTAIGIPASTLAAWAEAHADYVQITGDYPPANDRYWSRDPMNPGPGSQCAMALGSNKADRDACVSAFGTIDNPAQLSPERNLSILRASAGQLAVTPRNCSGDQCAKKLAQLACCFPAGTAYTVRASNQWLVAGTNGLHDLAVGANGRCVHTASCDPRKQYFGQRVFEVCDASGPNNKDCVNTSPTVGCVADKPKDAPAGYQVFPVDPTKPGKECIFENLTSRFVVYRGAEPSVPGMAFTWQTTGGFLPQTMSLTPQSSAVSPQSLGYLPQPGYLAVVDASTLGLILFDLNSLGVVLPSPYY